MTDSAEELNRQEKLRAILAARKATLLAELRKSMEEQRTENAACHLKLRRMTVINQLKTMNGMYRLPCRASNQSSLISLSRHLKNLLPEPMAYAQECGCEIPLQRLEIQPCASYCVACQEEIDRMSKRDKLVRTETIESTLDDDL